MQTPILVTGTHRSGSTWFGKLLGAASETFYIHEPLNIDLWPSWSEVTPEAWYPRANSSSDLWRAVGRVTELRYPLAANIQRARSPRDVGSVCKRFGQARYARWAGKRALIKDPFMLFNAELFSTEFGAPVVLTVRRPEAFVSSLVRLNWTFDFQNFLRQPELLEGDLQEWADEIREASERPPPLIEQGILLWRVLNGYIAMVRRRSPQVFVAVYEEFVDDVYGRLPKLYEYSGLAWNEEIVAQTASITTGTRIGTSPVDVTGDSSVASREWEKGLTASEVALVRQRTSSEAKEFYGNSH